MLSISEVQSKERGKISNLLKDYYKERGIIYSLKEIKDNFEPNDVVFAIKIEKKLIGTVSVNIKKDLIEIKNFFIDREFRRLGYGSQVLNFMLLYSKSKNARKIFSLTPEDYMRLFKKFGFIEECCLRSHFRDGENIVMMSLFLKVEKQLNLPEEIDKINIKKITSEQLSNLKLK